MTHIESVRNAINEHIAPSTTIGEPKLVRLVYEVAVALTPDGPLVAMEFVIKPTPRDVQNLHNMEV